MSRRMGRKFGLLFFCVLVVASNGQAASGWIRVQSPHFTLVGNAAELHMTSVATGLERFLQALLDQVPEVHPKATESIVIFILKDEASYEPFALRREGTPGSAPGYFLAGR